MKQLDLNLFRQHASSKKAILKTFYTKLKKQKPAKLDQHVHQFHEEAFEEIDCLACANCCKTTSPIFYQKDIERISNHLRIRPSEVIEKYLRIDEDKDYVLQQSPCTFLDADNYCTIYEARPNACREYPHTDRKKMIQILDLTFKNTQVCPAVLDISKKLMEIY